MEKWVKPDKGQTWQSTDRNRKNNPFRIVTISEGVAVCEYLASGRTSHIRLEHFRQSKRPRYRFIQ
jgi:hypothetical protein